MSFETNSSKPCKQCINFRVKYRRTRSKFENLSRSAALTQFVKYISDETPQNHSINTPKHPKAQENYAITHQKTFLTLTVALLGGLQSKRTQVKMYLSGVKIYSSEVKT